MLNHHFPSINKWSLKTKTFPQGITFRVISKVLVVYTVLHFFVDSVNNLRFSRPSDILEKCI